MPQLLAATAEVRRKVDQRAADNGAFGHYSRLNAAALDAMQLLLAGVDEPELADHLAPLINLAWIKERAGQSRGMLNGVLAAKALPIERYGQLSFYLASEADWLQRLQLLASPALRQQLDGLVTGSNWREVSQLSQAIMAQAGLPGAIDGPPPALWFALASERIEAVNARATSQAEALVAAAQQRVAQGLQRLWWGSALLLALVVALLLLVGRLVGRIGAMVERIRAQLQRVDEQGDFSCRVALGGDDELAAIGRSIDGHLQHMAQLFAELQALIRALDEGFSHIRHAVQQADDDASQTSQHMELVATAVTEMSQTSGDIASHMASSASATDRARNDGQQSLQLSQASAGAMAELAEEIERLSGSIIQVSAAAEEQSQVSGEINGSLQQVAHLAQTARQRLGGARQLQDELSQRFHALAALLARFRFG